MIVQINFGHIQLNINYTKIDRILWNVVYSHLVLLIGILQVISEIIIKNIQKLSNFKIV